MPTDAADAYLARLRAMDRDRNGRLSAAETLAALPHLVARTEALVAREDRRANTIHYSMPAYRPNGTPLSGADAPRHDRQSFPMRDETLYSAQDLLLPPTRPYDLPLAEAQSAVRRAFPRGVEHVTLSDVLEESRLYHGMRQRDGQLLIGRRGRPI